MSIGLACGAAQGIDDLLPTADRNLYRAKAEGRGRLVRTNPAPPTDPERVGPARHSLRSRGAR